MGLDYALQIMRAKKPGKQHAEAALGDDHFTPAHDLTEETGTGFEPVAMHLHAHQQAHPPSAHPTSAHAPSAHAPSAHPASAHAPSAHAPSAHPPSAHTQPHEHVGPQLVKQPSPPRTTRGHAGRAHRGLSAAALPWVSGPGADDDTASPSPALEVTARTASRPMLQYHTVSSAHPDSHAPQAARPNAPFSATRHAVVAAAAATNSGAGAGTGAHTRRRHMDPPGRTVHADSTSPGAGGATAVAASGPSFTSPGGGGYGSSGNSEGNSPTRSRRAGSGAAHFVQLPRVPSLRSRAAQQVSPFSPQGIGGGATATSDPGGVLAPSNIPSGGHDYISTSPGAGGGGGGGGGSGGGTLPAVRHVGGLRSSRLSSAALLDAGGSNGGGGGGNGGSGGSFPGAPEGVRGTLRLLLAEAEAEAQEDGWQRFPSGGLGGASGGIHSPHSLSRSGSSVRDPPVHAGEYRRRTGQGLHIVVSGVTGGASELPTFQSQPPLSLPALLHPYPQGFGTAGGHAASSSRPRTLSPGPHGSPRRRASRGPGDYGGLPWQLAPAYGSGGGGSGHVSPGEEGDEEGDVEHWTAELAALEQWAAGSQLDPAVVEATVEQHKVLRRVAQLRARLLRARAAAGSPGPGGAGPGGGGTAGGGPGATAGPGAAGAAGGCGGGGGALPSWLGAPPAGEPDAEGGGGGGCPNESLLALASAVTRLPHVDYEAIKDPQYRMALKAKYRQSKEALSPTAEALRELAGQERQRTIWKGAHG